MGLTMQLFSSQEDITANPLGEMVRMKCIYKDKAKH